MPMNQPLRQLLAILVAGAVAVVAFAFCLALYRMLWGLLAGEHPYIPTVITVGAVLISFVCSVRFMWRRLSLNPWSLSSPSTSVTTGLLVVTWAFGAPKVQTDLAAEEIGTYKKLRAENNRVWEVHPRIQFVASLPIAPAVLLTYHEYQLAGLYGEGRWDVHLWYGAGTVQLLSFGTWIS